MLQAELRGRRVVSEKMLHVGPHSAHSDGKESGWLSRVRVTP